MILVERHNIKGNSEIVKLCETSKELYNKCNYHMRKQWFFNLKNNDWTIPFLDINSLKALVRQEPSFDNLHNTKTAMQTVRRCLTDWSNFRKAIKAYNKNPIGFLSKPKPPYYKKKLAQVIFYNETIKGGLSGKILSQITPTNKCFSIKSDKKFKQVIITPKTFGFIVDVQYEQDVIKTNTKKITCAIDLGINNLCTITSDQHSPILVNGRIIKSINQWYNKKPNKRNSKKRYFRIENYFHHVSKFIIDNCIKYKIGTIIIGKNDGWKQNSKMSKKNNQNFVCVPFYKLLEKIKYKATLIGIKVIFTEESYTSKSSFFDNDPLPKYELGVEHQFSGKRKKRGLYVTSDNFVVNADVNGSLNIGRKVIPEFFGIRDRSLVARPVRINPLKISA